MIAIVDRQDAVVGHRTARNSSKKRTGIDDAGGIVAVPAFAIGGLVARDLLTQAGLRRRPGRAGLKRLQQLFHSATPASPAMPTFAG